ncbi:unnamed protein product [Alopecurus aequalis]
MPAFTAAATLAFLCLFSSSSPTSSLSSSWRSGACTGAAASTAQASTAAPAPASGTRSPASAAPLRRPSSSAVLEENNAIRRPMLLSLFRLRSKFIIFVMPSRMCLSSVHNTKGTHHSSNATSEQRWEESSCAMVSLRERGVAHVQGISRAELKENPMYSKALIINRTASPLAWFMECKDRKKHGSLMLPYTFLPSMPAKKLSDAANKMKRVLGDYDAIHVRRGDLLKNRKNRSGVERSLHPHLDRDTRPAFTRKRIAKWIPPGRTLYIASNERTPGFFSPVRQIQVSILIQLQ